MFFRAAHRVYRFLPASTRQSLFFHVASGWASLLLIGRTAKPGSLTVAGLLRSTVGLGQGARACFTGLRQLGYHPDCVDLSRVFHWHRTLSAQHVSDLQLVLGGVVIVHMNPMEFPAALVGVGRKVLHHKRIIGYWAWELSDIPRLWKRAFKFVDEIWVPSTFTARAIRPWTQLPLRVVPHPLMKPNVSRLGRADFGLPADAFVCLTMLDTRSSVARKNPAAAIAAFRSAFGQSMGAVLVVKIGKPDYASREVAELRTIAAGADNIKFLFDDMEPEDVAALMSCADAVISLHRSEGFGLVLAEAMLLGKPVVATGWSGNMDFMSDRNSALVRYELVSVDDPQGIYRGENQIWAEPDVEHAAWWLKQLQKDRVLSSQLGNRAAEDVRKYLGLEAFQRRISESLDDWCAEKPVRPVAS